VLVLVLERHQHIDVWFWSARGLVDSCHGPQPRTNVSNRHKFVRSTTGSHTLLKPRPPVRISCSCSYSCSKDSIAYRRFVLVCWRSGRFLPLATAANQRLQSPSGRSIDDRLTHPTQAAPSRLAWMAPIPLRLLLVCWWPRACDWSLQRSRMKLDCCIGSKLYRLDRCPGGA
jgi:hypothetical protein